MNIVIAMDSFKGSLSSLEAGNAVQTGILRAMPDAQTTVRPLADGGEGTVEALTAGMGGSLVTVPVTGPLGGCTDAVYGILNDGKRISKRHSIRLIRKVSCPWKKRYSFWRIRRVIPSGE